MIPYDSSMAMGNKQINKTIGIDRNCEYIYNIKLLQRTSSNVTLTFIVSSLEASHVSVSCFELEFPTGREFVSRLRHVKIPTSCQEVANKSRADCCHDVIVTTINMWYTRGIAQVLQVASFSDVDVSFFCSIQLSRGSFLEYRPGRSLEVQHWNSGRPTRAAAWSIFLRSKTLRPAVADGAILIRYRHGYQTGTNYWNLPFRKSTAAHATLHFFTSPRFG